MCAHWKCLLHRSQQTTQRPTVVRLQRIRAWLSRRPLLYRSVCLPKGRVYSRFILLIPLAVCDTRASWHKRWRSRFLILFGQSYDRGMTPLCLCSDALRLSRTKPCRQSGELPDSQHKAGVYMRTQGSLLHLKLKSWIRSQRKYGRCIKWCRALNMFPLPLGKKRKEERFYTLLLQLLSYGTTLAVVKPVAPVERQR